MFCVGIFFKDEMILVVEILPYAYLGHFSAVFAQQKKMVFAGGLPVHYYKVILMEKNLLHSAYKPGKGGCPLIDPLPRQAVALLREMRTLSGRDRYVFPSAHGRGRPMSENTVNAALHRMGYKDQMSAHGFRAMARTILNERLHYEMQYIEMQLGHQVRDANGRAYNRATFLDQRREMLQAWADYLDGLRGTRG